MSTQMRQLLDELAADARGYGDPDRAVATARRRVATGRVAVPLGAAALVAVAALAASPLGSPDRVDVGPPAGTAPRPGPVADYPARVTVPSRVDSLPARTGARAAFVYAPCPTDCDPYVVLTDGRQYRLMSPDMGPPVYGYTLSPDGAWLGYPTADGFDLLHLVDGEFVSIPDSGPGVTNAWVWSPDGRSLLLARHRDGDVDHYLVVRPYEGGRPRRLAPPAAAVVAMRDNGDLVAWVGGGGAPGHLPTLAIAPAGTSTLGPPRPVRLPPDRADLLRADESLQIDGFHLAPGGDSGLLVVNGPSRSDDARPSAGLHLELADARVTSRIEVPPSRPDATASWQVWGVGGYLPGGVVLVHWTPDRSEIVLVNDVTGERAVATTMPANSLIVVRGHGRY